MQGQAERPSAAPDAAPKRNRTIIVAGLALCVVLAVVLAYLLGALDRVGTLS